MLLWSNGGFSTSSLYLSADFWNIATWWLIHSGVPCTTYDTIPTSCCIPSLYAWSAQVYLQETLNLANIIAPDEYQKFTRHVYFTVWQVLVWHNYGQTGQRNGTHEFSKTTGVVDWATSVQYIDMCECRNHVHGATFLNWLNSALYISHMSEDSLFSDFSGVVL